MAGGFGAASFPLISAIALLIGAVLIVLGFAAPYWAFNGVAYEGLWGYGNCVKPGNRDCYYYDKPSLRHIPSYLHVVRALECICVALVAIPLVILPVYMYVALGMKYRCMMASMCISCLLSAIAGIIGVAIYGANLSENKMEVAWCTIIVAVGCACVFIGFLILLVACITKRPELITEPYYPTTIFVDPHKNKLYTVRLEEED